MEYGYFAHDDYEYVITRPDTPAPWANYLGSPAYGAIISNNAGGYSFVKSGAAGRVTRYRFNGVPADTPGRYIYVKDAETGEFWANSYAPVLKGLGEFKYECRHGMAYTRISSEYGGVKSECAYYVPRNAEHEVWSVKITNSSGRARKLSVTGYAEFTNEPNYEQDSVNLQYTLFISKTYFKGNAIIQKYNENLNDPGNERFFGLSRAAVSGYCGSREDFTGKWRGYDNPAGVADGLKNTLNYNLNSCGALQTDFSLAPGETKTFVFTLGQKPEAEAEKIIAAYEAPERAEAELTELKNYWRGLLGNLRVKTPDECFNNMINVWNAYQCFVTFIWSRAASLIYCGLRNGYGYRDTVQDIQGIIHLAPEMAREQIVFMLSAQAVNGAGLPLVKYGHRAGFEDTPEDASYVSSTGHPSYRADDALWLFPTIYKYIAETGDLAFLDFTVPYANNGEKGTVYDHLKRAVSFSVNNSGPHGMPAGLHADWNDCVRLGKTGESAFVAFQFIYAINILLNFAMKKNDAEYLKTLEALREKQLKAAAACWDGDRFIRGYAETGETIGKKGDPEANLWLNPQSWAVISGVATPEQAKTAMDNVYEKLNTPYGLMIMTPPYRRHAFDGALMRVFNAYTKENAGIFSQTQGWAILAEALMGRGGRAFEYWRETSPAYMNARADLRVIEPYAHGQFTEGSGSPFAGRSHVHWLTGTASTVMVASVEGILGIRPQMDGIRISPSVPPAWSVFSFDKVFRGKKLHVTVNNPNGVESGVLRVCVNGEKTEGGFIAETLLKDENEIIVTMG